MIGVAVVALFANVASSIKYSMTDLLDRSFGGDLVVRPDGFSGAGLEPELADGSPTCPRSPGPHPCATPRSRSATRRSGWSPATSPRWPTSSSSAR
jgi:hypothetical protein